MRSVAAAATVLLALTLAACNSGPDVAACEKAMRDQIAHTSAGSPPQTRPAECEGVSDKDVQDIATRILAGTPSSS